MNRMDPTKPAIFFHLKTVLYRLFILRRCVIPSLALATGKCHNICHFKTTFTVMEPTTRIELVTSSLPRMCSTY
jgi:hypothetical protein